MKKKNVKKELIKARKFKNATPGQDRDFETLDANRMFKAYEDVEIDELTVDQKKKREASRERTHGGKSGGERKGLFHGSVDSYKRMAHDADRGQKKPDSNVRKVWQKASSMRAGPQGKLPEDVEMEDAPTTSTTGVANWNPVLGGKRPRVVYKKRRNVDGRTKDYKETVTRLQARRDASAARELEQKLNMFGVQSNPFREDTQMENKKYLKTKEGSIEDAVLQSLRTETPFNPNDARPTLHLPEKKYLDSKEGSLENAVTDVMVTETISGNMQRDLKMLDSHRFLQKYRMSKAHAQRAGSGIQRLVPKGATGPASDERQEAAHDDVDAYDYKAKKGAIAAPGSGSIAKAKKAKSSDVNKSIEQQMADARKEEVEIDESWKKVKPTDRVQRVGQLSISGWLSKQMGRKGDPHKFNHKVPSIYFDDVDLVVDDKTVVPKALLSNVTMADLLKKVQAHAKKKRLRWESVEIDEAQPTSKQVKMAKGIAWDKRHRGGDMTGAWKKAEKIKKGLGDHPKVQSALRKANEEDDRGVGSKGYTEYVRNLTPGETAVKDPEAAKASSASKQASAEKKRQVTKIDDAVDPEMSAARAQYKKGSTDMKKQHILDVAKIKASKVGEEVIVGLLDMGIIQVNENTETGFEVINDPVANRENLLRMAYNTGVQILAEYQDAPIDELSKKTLGRYAKKSASEIGGHMAQGGVSHAYDRLGKQAIRGDLPSTQSSMAKAKKRRAGLERAVDKLSAEYVPQGTEIDEKKVSSDAYDHATALYKDQWKDRKIADYDKEHDKDSRAKEMRKDAEVDRKRMWAMTGDKWKHAKGSSGEVKGKKSEVGNPDPKDAYKKEELSYHEQLMGEAGKWIQKAIKRPGALHRDLGVPEDEKIPKSKIKAAAKEGGKVGQRARLAITLGKMNK